MSGIVARCYAAGECFNESDTEMEKVGAFMKDYAVANPKHGFAGDAISSPSSAQYYGYAVHAGRW